MITMWRDKNVDEMTREEAITALKECGHALKTCQDAQLSSHEFYRDLLGARRRRDAR